jgi:hypothetical protein
MIVEEGLKEEEEFIEKHPLMLREFQRQELNISFYLKANLIKRM